MLSDADLSRIVRLYAHAVAIADSIRFRMWHERELTTVQLRALILIRGEPGLTASELASRAGVTPPTISGLMDRLVRQNLVRRAEDATDRRVVRHYLTDEGHAVVGELVSEGMEALRRVLNRLSASERNAVERGLVLLVEAADEELEGAHERAAAASR